MDDDENYQLFEMDTETDTDKKTRRSSILKPQKPRNPLSLLDFSEANPDTTLARATRRVSFASSNFVKPFAADPEKNTIWDNTYEEEVNHTDSTKSSCDQTHGTKNSNFLNTSLYSPTTELHQSYKNAGSCMSLTTNCINVDEEVAANEVVKSGESLVSLARKLRSQSGERYGTESMDFTLINKVGTEFPSGNEIQKETVRLQENISVTSPFHNKVGNIFCSTTKLTENTMEMTCITDKENVNPLINDLSLVMPRRNISATNITKYFIEEHMDCTKLSEKIVHFNKSESNLDFTGLDATKESCAIAKNVYADCTSGMEFTCLSEENDKRKQNEKIELAGISSKNALDDGKMKTIFFDDSMNGMELTKEDKSEEVSENVSSNKSKRRTIIFGEVEGDMDLTIVSDVASKENIEIREIVHEIELKSKTIILNQSDDMEFTATLPVKIYNNNVSNAKQQATTHFNDSGEDMEFTNTFQTQKNIKETKSNKDLKETICFEKSEDNMEFTKTLVGKINNAVNSTISQIDDMEVTTALSTETIENNLVEIQRLSSDMELTSTLQINVNKLRHCDTSLAQNNNSDIASCRTKTDLIKNVNSSTVNASSTSNLTLPDALGCRNLSENGENIFSNPPLIVKDSACDDNSDGRTNISSSSNNINLKNRSLTTGNGQQRICSSSTVDHQGIGNDTASVSKDTNHVKRHIDSVDGDTIKKRRIQQSQSHDEKSCIENMLPEPSATKPLLSDDKENAYIKSSKTSNIVDQNALSTHEPSSARAHDTNLQTSTLSNSNILYSEPMKVKLKTSKFVPISELSAHLNLDGSLNLDHVSTPATSFHINLSAMSPCIEDTQQLIHATFSKPETLKILNDGGESFFGGSGKAGNVLKLDESPVKVSAVSRRQETICREVDSSVKVNENLLVKDVKRHVSDTKFVKMIDESLKKDKSCFLEDTTPLTLVPEEFDNSDAEDKSPKQNNSVGQDDSVKDTSSSDFGNYTLRSQIVLTNIEKHLLTYEDVPPQMNLNVSKLIKEFKENCRVIDEFCESKIYMDDLEAKNKQDLEETLSSVNEAAVSTDEDLGALPTLGLIAPKTICNRICEIAERAKKYWDFVKMEGDYCYFYTLLGTLPFKVHIHPELGIVYSVNTFTNLSDLAPPICWYQLKLFQHKLKQENLLSVLSAKYDIFTLLDYIYMSMEEIMNFRTEYWSLVKKYGKSHHFRMNPDYSVTFEILNLKQIICWIVTVNMSLTSLTSISKEDITAVAKVGKILIEEHIKTIVENTPKGINFLRSFIENVDEYVNRMGRRIKREKMLF